VPAGGRLSVRAQRSGDRLEVSVSDTGGGFGGGVSGSGFGLANVKARLHTLYGPHGSLELCENKPHGVTATLWLPHRLVGGRA
jgi:signal transduction histidine kinase